MSDAGKPVGWRAFASICLTVAGLLIGALWELGARIMEAETKSFERYETLSAELGHEVDALRAEYTDRINGVVDHFGAEDSTMNRRLDAMNRRLDAVAASVNTPRAQAVYPKRP